MPERASRVRTFDPEEWKGPWRCRACGHVFSNFHSHCGYCPPEAQRGLGKLARRPSGNPSS